MSLLTTNQLFEPRLAPAVRAVTLDRSVDFSLVKTELPFSHHQKDFLSSLGIQGKYINIRQVHGHKVLRAPQETPDDVLLEADGLITNEPDTILYIRTADCLPIFLYDKLTHAMGLVHAGWRGTQQSIASRTVKKMTEVFGTQPKNVSVAFGPCICKDCYKVGEEFLMLFPEDTLVKKREIHFDLIKANERQLEDAGVPTRRMIRTDVCTFHDERCFSYRREKEKAGRMLSLMVRSGKR